MVNIWETENEEDKEERDSVILHESISKHAGENARVSSYKVEAHLILEGSDKHNWGYVSFIESSFSDKPGEMCGTWSRSPMDSHMHVFLAVNTRALLARATELNDKRQDPSNKFKRSDRSSGTKSKEKTIPHESPSTMSELASEMQATIDNVRRSLGIK